MAAITDFDEYRGMLSLLPDSFAFYHTSSAVVAGRPYDSWLTNVPSGSAPTTGAVPDNSTAGGIQHRNGGSGQLWIAGARANAGFTPGGVYLICDRLSHQGGLSGTVTTAQTTNLPTAALTRHTSGEGVMIGLTTYTAVGTTATTVSCSYTNQAGTAGRTTPLVVFGSTGFREQHRLVLLPLQVGDTGVRSVESVTVTATTGTAGNFGVTLFKPLAAVCIVENSGVQVCDFVTGGLLGGIPEVIDDACLFAMPIMAGTNGGGAGTLLVSEV